MKALVKIVNNEQGDSVIVTGYQISHDGQGKKVGVGQLCRSGILNGRKVKGLVKFYLYINRDMTVDVSYLGKRERLS